MTPPDTGMDGSLKPEADAGNRNRPHSMAGALGYLVPEFPSQTHVFFWREVMALRRQELSVQWLSTRRPEAAACRHAFAQDATRETIYLFPPRWTSTLVWLMQRPGGSWRAIAYAKGLRESTWRERLRVMALIPSAAELCMQAKAVDIRHVHVHSCANAAHLAALAHAISGLPYSLSLHGDLPVYGKDHANKSANARFVCAVTRPLQHQLQESAGLAADRTPLLWMGVETSRFIDAGRRSSTSGQLVVLTVARLNPTKGHTYALHAIQRMVRAGLSVRYQIAGAGDHRAAIEAEVASLSLTDHVELLGTRSEDEVLELMQSADVFLLTSVGRGEAAPVSVMEAMSCALPVVCSVIGGTPDMIESGVDGFLVPQRDVDAIEEKLTLLAIDHALRHQMGQAARRTAVRMFDVDVLAVRMVHLLTTGRGGIDIPDGDARRV